MSVTAIGRYDHASHDTAHHFAAPLLYVGWDEHMMFAAPAVLALAPDTTFAHLRGTVLAKLYGEHPDFAAIDWSRVQWFRGGTMFTPTMDGTLASHGFGHKSVLRFRTPGLEGLRGSCG
ncbi:MAG: phenol hydroxylase subunit P4 [Burkholderiaceae bacterium]|nr:phenol hydroxylase subunit P4 [Burkholderiaceae bacterium]